MNLFRKAAVAFGALAALTATGEPLVIREARAASDRVAEFKERSGAYQRTVQALVKDLYLYDDQNNMYVLVAATSPTNTTLIEDTYAQGVIGLQQFGVDGTRVDEIGDLGRGFNIFVGRLQRVMGTFRESSAALLTASDALSAISIATGQNADETSVQAGAPRRGRRKA